MKLPGAIVFSLLLIVAQTFAVAVPVSGGVSVAKPDCCCEDCRCCVSETGTPSAPPVESTAPAAAQNQFVLPAVAVLSFTLAARADESVPARADAPHAVALPLFRQNCSLLI